MYQPEVDIYLDRLNDNFKNLQSIVGKAKIMAVVKSNAYGHGMIPISKQLVKSGVHGFCVALATEVEELIGAKINNPILHLGRMHPNYLEIYKTGQVRCTINEIDDLQLIKENFKNINSINVHLKIDTGMGRMGVPYSKTKDILEIISHISSINVEGVYSHFSTAEEQNTDYRDWQLERFNKVVKLTKAFLPNTKYFHIANSASILNCPASHFSMVRPGISLYGVSPLGVLHDKLKPVMVMKGAVVLKKDIKNGDSIGYSRLYVSKNDAQIAIVQAGYADGILTVFSNNGSVLINGSLYSIIGKVSMDLVSILCDNRVSIGDEVIFWGSKNNNLEYLAKKYKKIPYEFLTGVSNRVNRNFIHV